MGTSFVDGVKTFTKATSATLAPYERVALNSSNQIVQAGAGQRGIGVVSSNYSSTTDGDQVAVKLFGSSGSFMMLAAGAISAGAAVFASASGRCDDAANMGEILGYACDAASGNGSQIEILPVNGVGAGVPTAYAAALTAGVSASATLTQALVAPGKLYIRVNVTADITLFASGGGAALAGGLQFLDLATGIFSVDWAKVSGTFVTTGGGTTAGEIGLGTVVASGAAAVLGGTATFENILEGGIPALGNAATGVATAFNVADVARAELSTIAAAADVFVNGASTFAAGAGNFVLKSGSVIEMQLNFVPQTTV